MKKAENNNGCGGGEVVHGTNGNCVNADASRANYNKDIYSIIKTALKDPTLLTTDGKLVREHLERCKDLYKRDYEFITVDNSNGQLCSSYPVELIIPTEQKDPSMTAVCSDDDAEVGSSGSADDEEATNFDESEFLQLLSRGRFARTRGRFPVPVFMVFGKHICRSSTLARSAEIYGRCGLNYIYPLDLSGINGGSGGANVTNGTNGSNGTDGHTEAEAAAAAVQYRADETAEAKIEMPTVVAAATTAVDGAPVIAAASNKEWMIDKMRKTDIEVLKFLKVHVICDLMVEKKKLKYGMHVTSSEKVDSSRRYDQFQLVSVPYPGCEFFADYSNNNYDGSGLLFDWSQQFIDADLQIPEEITKNFDFNWDNYCDWDLITLTQNYTKLMLSCINEKGSNGFLVHCISGWDRTPLFVSILRISLWADNLIHQSLSAEEMLYLTLVYDWLLFSHQFADRIRKSEEILHFCFEFLQHISGPEYSLIPENQEEEDDEEDEDDKAETLSDQSGHITPTLMRCESTSDSEQLFQLDPLNDSKTDLSPSLSQCNINSIPVDFTSQRVKLNSSNHNSNTAHVGPRHVNNSQTCGRFTPVTVTTTASAAADDDEVSSPKTIIAGNGSVGFFHNASSTTITNNGGGHVARAISDDDVGDITLLSSSFKEESYLGPKFMSNSAVLPTSNGLRDSNGVVLYPIKTLSSSLTERTNTIEQNNNNVITNDVESSNVATLANGNFVPNINEKVLSSSLECSNGTRTNGVNTTPDQSCGRLASALSADTLSNVVNTGRSSSDPILVPSRRAHHKLALSAECLTDENKNRSSSVSSKGISNGSSSFGSPSYNGTLAEPGSSWQMISSPPTNSLLNLTSLSDLSPSSFISSGLTCEQLSSLSHPHHRIRKDSSLISSEPSLLNGDCSSSAGGGGGVGFPREQVPQPAASGGDVAGGTTTASTLTTERRHLQLERRKERLDALREIMIPTYNAVLNDIVEEQKQQSFLSYFTTLVKRS